MRVPKVVPISELRADAAALVKETNQSGRPIFITQRGRATAVLMSMEEYEAADDAAMHAAIRRGLEQMERGEGRSFEEVMGDSARIIAEHE